METLPNFPKNSFSSLGKLPEVCINLSLSQQYCDDLFSFLLKGNIPFSVTFQNDSLERPKVSMFKEDIISQKEVSDVPNESRNNSLKKCAETIYEKYVIGMLSHPVPKESIIASEFDLSPSRFKSLFLEYYGKSFYQLYMDKKMEYAAKLLLEGFSCGAVSKKVGYSAKSAIKFNKMFQKHFGITPKRYQNSNGITLLKRL